MLEPLAVAVWAVDLGHVKMGSTAAVLGTGVLGGLTAMLLNRLGCRQVICSDLRANRLELAQTFGATHTIDASRHDTIKEIARITNDRGVDVVFKAMVMA